MECALVYMYTVMTLWFTHYKSTLYKRKLHGHMSKKLASLLVHPRAASVRNIIKVYWLHVPQKVGYGKGIWEGLGWVWHTLLKVMEIVPLTFSRTLTKMLGTCLIPQLAKE